MATTPQVNIQQVNLAARAAILSQGIEMTQNIFSTTIANPGSANNVVNVVPRNVGLIKGFIVKVKGTIANATGGGTAVALTNYNAANLLSQIVFNDLNNNVRINTTGWHMNFVNTAKNRRVFGAAATIDSPIKYGSNFSKVIAAPATIADAGSGDVYMTYYVPLAYSDDDLRGSVYANVVNATMNLQLTINPTPVGAAANSTLSNVYSAAGGAGSFTSVTIDVYQVYLDQLPMGKNGPILPILDLSTVYELKNTALTGIVVSQDFPIPYSNFRDFLSTLLVYQNGTQMNSGTDVNYISLQSANFTNILKVDPYVLALKSRNQIGDDFPPATYYIDTRRKPISTIQYGNMQLNLNASLVNANASVLMGYEDFALVNVVTGAGSLAAS